MAIFVKQVYFWFGLPHKPGIDNKPKKSNLWINRS